MHPPRVLHGEGRVTAALGVVQILAWGTTYYLPAILSGAVIAVTGWPTLGVTGGLSLGLLLAGLAATRTGRLIERHGGRPVLAGAMGLIATGLAVLALATGLPIWMLGWGITGLAMGAGLYDAAFSTLGRIYGTGARRAITRLTLGAALRAPCAGRCRHCWLRRWAGAAPAALRTGVPASVAVIAYGAGVGIKSIAQGTLPLAVVPLACIAVLWHRVVKG